MSILIQKRAASWLAQRMPVGRPAINLVSPAGRKLKLKRMAETLVMHDRFLIKETKAVDNARNQ